VEEKEETLFGCDDVVTLPPPLTLLFPNKPNADLKKSVIFNFLISKYLLFFNLKIYRQKQRNFIDFK
jgi:hypothetical protein